MVDALLGRLDLAVHLSEGGHHALVGLLVLGGELFLLLLGRLLLVGMLLLFGRLLLLFWLGKARHSVTDINDDSYLTDWKR